MRTSLPADICDHFATNQPILTMHITRRIEFDAGHRIPNHQSQCRHLHGHRYALEITLGGGVIDAAGQPDDGMMMEFGQDPREEQDAPEFRTAAQAEACAT